ncbi:DNA internalization-related competence protein ComEC/Rec2 [Mariprofundus erugo]|uniref:DNA internalization-related competence protein ComEC/Rec2 n=1 Tax=Mariprofundus erugo TaxID=2528639 RepID=A0A5R9GSD2_9PROT|nr:DNA internalization-related competence protein ComEC/Rec2 [Mariprofundus erugo]TLS69111.1 DNA internalization-related competence protein ComEC/Rec2 [Mariprofundus erugo]
MVPSSGSADVSWLQCRRLPLLWPVLAWTTGLVLARSDLVGVVPALLIWLLLLLLFVWQHRMVALWLLLGGLWGAADLLVDAARVSVTADWLNGAVTATARIDEVHRDSALQRLQLSDIRRQDGARLSGHALLYLYHHAGESYSTFQPGDRIRMTARWHRPRNHLNPGGFDYQAWCFDHHIALIGSVSAGVQLAGRDASPLQNGRARIANVIGGLPADAGGVLQALLLGDRSGVTEPVKSVFSATGTAHLLAISGMHVGMVAAWMALLFRWMLTRREAWIVRLRVRDVAMAAGVIAAGGYAMVAGWPLPAMRAALMLAAAAIAWFLAARHAPLNILLAALALILLFDPAAVVSLSLWLSFAATAALLIWATRMLQTSDHERAVGVARLRRAVPALLVISLLALLATLPVSVAAFGRLPVYALVANLMVVPLYSLLVMPLALSGEIFALLGWHDAAVGLMQIAGRVVQMATALLTWLTTLPAGQLWGVYPPLWLGAVYMAGMLMAGRLLLRGRRRLAGLLALLTLCFYLLRVSDERSVDAPLWVVWDVGQGASSTLLLPGGYAVVTDVPGRPGSRINGGSMVAGGMRQLGVTHADMLILSHAQSDHLGGAWTLLQSLNVTGQIGLPDVPAVHADPAVRAMIAYAREQQIGVRWLARGDGWHVERGGLDVRFDVLWPPRGFAPKNENNTSLVVAVSWGDKTRLLWPGDIELAGEQELAAAVAGGVDAMLMPHHGSMSSSSVDFVRMFAPGLAVAQSGWHNRYGLPADAVMQRYRQAGAIVRNSADGAVLVRWPAAGGGAPESVQWQQAAGRRQLALRSLEKGQW